MGIIAERLTKAREAKGLSQTDVARLARVTPQSIQAIEAGKVLNPRNIMAIAHAVGLTAEELLAEPDDLPEVYEDEHILQFLRRIRGLSDRDSFTVLEVIHNAVDAKRAKAG